MKKFILLSIALFFSLVEINAQRQIIRDDGSAAPRENIVVIGTARGSRGGRTFYVEGRAFFPVSRGGNLNRTQLRVLRDRARQAAMENAQRVSDTPPVSIRATTTQRYTSNGRLIP